MKKYRIQKRIVSVVLSLAVLCGALKITGLAFRKPDSAEKYYSFFEEDTEYDAFIVGNSHALNGIFPMQLWKDYGITSYNIAGHGLSLNASYYMLRQIMEYKKPEIVVIDIYGAIWDEQKQDTVSMAHTSFDVFPLSTEKIQAAFGMFSDSSEALELLFPFSVYHGRWSELSFSDMIANIKAENHNHEKGAESRVDTAVPAEYTQIAQDEKADLSDAPCMEELEKLIEYCLQNDLEVVLINLPCPLNEKYQRRVNLVQDIADKYEIDYLNMGYYDIVDFEMDLYDEDSHLNPSGARQTTEYLGQYLVNKFEIEDKRENPEFQNWNEDYEEYYQEILLKNMEEEDDLTNTLMLLNNNNFTADISFPEDFCLDTRTVKQLERIADSAEYDMDNTEQEIVINIYQQESGEFLFKKVFNSEGQLVN